jgi:hypothetical protein
VEDLLAAAAEPLKCQHVIAHASSVSPPTSTIPLPPASRGPQQPLDKWRLHTSPFGRLASICRPG